MLGPFVAPSAAYARTRATIHRAAAPPPTTPPPPPPPKAWILVDADTGNVIDAGNDHEPMQPASLTKVITALAAKAFIPEDGTVPVSARAQGAPAMSMNMKAGQQWPMKDALHALLMVSANDAAYALAERAAGSVEQFENVFASTAQALGMQDHPVLRDPAGLDDDQFSVDGGNLVSARDLAIAARALLADPVLADIVATPIYKFHGPDNVDHRLVNHNRMLTVYPGAVGVKTGYTKRAGSCLIAAARRDGRTMLAVVENAWDMYGVTSTLLDKGFATPVEAEVDADHLPPVPGNLQLALTPAKETPPSIPPLVASRPPAPAPSHSSTKGRALAAVITGGAGSPVLIVEALLIGLGLMRLRAVRRNRRRRPRPAHARRH